MVKVKQKRPTRKERIEKLAIDGEAEKVKYKYSAAKTTEICGYLREGLNITDSCTLADISKETYYRWQREHSDFYDATKVAELACKRANIKIILGSAKKNWTASAWWLERKYKDEFAAKTIEKHEGSVAVGYGDLEKAESVEEAKKSADRQGKVN
jgi:hypothetical protein